MQDAATQRRIELLKKLLENCAAVSERLSELALQQTEVKPLLALSAEARHCDLSLRMSIRLVLDLEQGIVRLPRAPRTESSAQDPDASDRDPAELDTRLEYEPRREYERDYEPVSLDRLINTLSGVTARAERRDDLPADLKRDVLPQLRADLAALKGEPQPPAPKAPAPKATPGLALLTRPEPKPPSTRARLLGSVRPRPSG